MSKPEILAALEDLQAQERREVFERLCQLEEEDLLRGAEPEPDEKKILDAALKQFEADGEMGRPWKEVLRQINGSANI